MRGWRAARYTLIGSLLAFFCAVAPSCALFHGQHPATAPVNAHVKVRLTIVGTNDLHGWLEPHEPPEPHGTSLIGGVDMLGGYLDVLRSERPGRVILLDAGDLFQGTLVANLTEGSAVVKAYNALQYDAVAIGNHEFDYGPVGDAVVALTPSDDPVGALKARISEAHFPFLSGNIYDRATGQPVDWDNAPQTTLLRRAGITIGVIGLTTPTTPSVTLAQNVQGLLFKPLVPTTIALAAKLREQGARIVIVTMHAGAGCPLANGPHDLAHCSPGEVFPFLRALPPGTVDAVIAGHTHQLLAQFVDGVPVVQSASYGRDFGIIELTYDKTAGSVDTSATRIWKPIPLCRWVYKSTGTCLYGSGPLTRPVFLGQPAEPDLKVAAVVAPDIEDVKERESEKLGPQLGEPFTRSRTAESTLGDLVADIMRENVAGAQVGLTNSGGLRADIGRGAVTYGRVFDALPFENRLAVLHLTGAQLLAMLNRGVSGEHGLIQVSGVQLQVVEPKARPCAADGSRLISATFSDGSPIVLEQTYTVVTNDFIAGGGDGFDAVMKKIDPENVTVRNDLPPVREMLVSYFRFHPDLSGPPATEARIQMIKPACAAASSSR